MRFFYFLFLLSLLSISINAQITITPGGTATSIINTFVSNGIVVTNPIINCGSTSYGSYTGNLQAGGIGLSNGGIILTTGSAIGADGPNTSTLFGLEVLGYDYADPQLTSQPGAGTPPPSFDNCRVEFDMTPICSSFNIAFVFGSEEYPEYVTGAYNDGFGIFVSGPNPLGGNYTSYNMARLPNGQLVSIDNVNSNLNNSYYNTNNTGVMQYDGYTDGLTAQLAVIPCSTYHIKIIIADAGDQLWDSGIFLGAGSFACSMPALSITASPTTICAGASTTLTASTAATGGTYLWSPGGATTQSITVNPSTTTTYTCSYTFSSCSVITATTTVTVATITPSFQPIGPYCSGATVPVLPTSSTNTPAITGTWSPAVSNTATTTYTFTPTAGQCGTTQTMSITITPNITPLFTQVGPYCSGATILPLATISTNSITGTWSPDITNTATSLYTFTPTAGLCATTQTVSITITPNITPLFTQVGPYCSGETIPPLLSTSTNSITGMWSPALSNIASTTYTFSPTLVAGQCNSTQTMSITITPNITPLFTQVGPYCSGATIPPLATNSTNSITGIWSPAINNTATTTYTFTPTAGLCATTQTVSITITPNASPLFTQVGPYCSGSTIPSLLSTSINGISGTWSPAINNTATTTYTFTPTAVQCATNQTMSITITPNITPLFTQVGPYCSGATIPQLPTNSINGITGTWSPAINNTASTTYTFTPTAGQCGTTQTMSITITPNIIPLFTQVGPYCIEATISSLPTSSINGISGTWGPEINNSATTTYTFTPTAGLCATTQTMSISINLPILPSFTQVGPYCSGATIPSLLSTSINGITGTWLPAINNSATTTYTFTPTAGLCATTQTMNIVISQNTTPTFSQVGPFCSEASISPLPTSSTNGISGTWAPAINNTATTTYTFTPTAGLCATIQTMSITITLNTSPLFTQVGPFCSGGTISPLPTSSTNGISGIWSPAINNAATTTYTFSPTLITGECASTQTMSIIISPIITSTWSEVVCVSELPFLWNGISYNGAGIYSYYTETAGGCDSTAILNLSISPTPLTSFIPSISLFTESPQLVAFTNTTVGASSYSWDFGDGSYSTDDNPEYVFAENTNGQSITLFAESSEGCIGTYQVSIEFDEGLVYYIPNTFTPDHDEYNQTFRPIFTSGFDPYNYEMLIFNRWGEIIFETHDVTYGWDGTYSFTNSICQDGVYSYKITFKNPNLDERKVVCGSVNLLK